VKLILEDGTTYPIDGELRVSDVTVDQTTGAVTLRAVFRNPNGVLLPGMFVRAVLQEAEAPSAMLVPQGAVTRDPQGRAAVFVVAPDSKVQTRVIEAPRTVGASWLVTSGLNSGERVIVEGVQKVKAGMLVKAVLAGSPTPTAAAK
jgi:membrane fusion protein (multidrug efflux system)